MSESEQTYMELEEELANIANEISPGIMEIDHDMLHQFQIRVLASVIRRLRAKHAPVQVEEAPDP